MYVMRVHVCVSFCVCLFVWRSEIGVGCTLTLHCIFGTESLSDPGAHCLSQVVWLASPGILLSTEFAGLHFHTQLFMWVLGIELGTSQLCDKH